MTSTPQWANDLTDDEAEFDRRMRLQLNEPIASDVQPDQVWRHIVTQAHQRHNAIVREVRDGVVHFHGDEAPVSLGGLLAYWAWVA